MSRICCVKLVLDASQRLCGEACLSGRSAAWLARLVRDQEVDGSNPFAPTNLSPALIQTYTATTFCFSTHKTCPGLSIIGCCLREGNTKPWPTLLAHSRRHWMLSSN